jgi:hypothetical protein
MTPTEQVEAPAKPWVSITVTLALLVTAIVLDMLGHPEQAAPLLVAAVGGAVVTGRLSTKRDLHTIHVLVNNRLTEALDKIDAQGDELAELKGEQAPPHQAPPPGA